MTDRYSHARATPGFDSSAGLLNAEEVAALYRVTPHAVWGWARNDKIPHLRTPGGDWRFSKRWVYEQLGMTLDG